MGGIIELPYNIYMGGGIIEVGDRIKIEDGYKEKGSFNLAYVKVARANIPTYLVSYVMGWEREPKSEMLIDENDDSSKLWDREQMYLQQSIDDATINAYRLAGKEVNIKSYHFEVLYVLNENTDIKPKDKILKINGMDVTNFDDLGIYIRENKVDDVVPVLVERDGKEIECTVKLYVLDDYLKMGIYLIKVTDYEVNPKIDIKFTNREGGSSGGFMLSLAIYNRLVKEDITHGLKIVGTGTIDSEGNIGLFGEFLTNAQGEDVVAGVRTPMKITEMEEKFPEAFAQFKEVCHTLETHYRDMQDMEFTVEHGKLYMLQTRNGKRTAQAALKIACDLVDEGMRTPEEAVEMIDPRNLDTLLHPQFDADALKEATPLGKGLGASPGAACGKVVFTAEDADSGHDMCQQGMLSRC